MSVKLMDKVRNFMGFDAFEEEEFMEDEILEEHQDNMVPMINNRRGKVVNIHTASQMKVVLFEPSNFEEAANIVNDLKARKPVIINLEGLDPELARKFFDFLSGAVYALDGDIQKVSSGIFVLAPNNVDITGNIREELKNKSVFPWHK